MKLEWSQKFTDRLPMSIDSRIRILYYYYWGLMERGLVRDPGVYHAYHNMMLPCLTEKCEATDENRVRLLIEMLKRG